MPRSRFLPASLAAILAACVLVPASAADAARTHHRDPASVSLTGRGYGHGHGLSQWGAEGAAKQGLSAQQILAFYYPGLAKGTTGGRVSVLISADTGRDLVVSARAGLKVQSLANNRTYTLGKRAVKRWRITPADGGRRSAIAYQTKAWHLLRTVPGEAQFTAGGAPITLQVHGGASVQYRGVLRSAAHSATSSRRDTVNVLPLESYLRGVVPREAYPTWHPAALEAQSVAARTYAAFERQEPLARDYQICDTSACQVYGGYSSEVASTTRAVRATHGQIITSSGKPAFTQFSASNGGWMAAGSEPYLVAKQDPYDTVYRNWHATVTATAIEKAFPAIGAFQSATVGQRDGNGAWHGRVLTIELTGSRTSTTISGEAFRSYFGLMSTWFTLT